MKHKLIIGLITGTVFGALLINSTTSNARVIRMKHCFHNEVWFAEMERTDSCELVHNQLPHNDAPQLPNNIEQPKVESHLCVIGEENFLATED